MRNLQNSIILLIVFFSIVNVYSQDFVSDTLAVRAILDSNKLYSLPVCSVAFFENERIYSLSLRNRNLTCIPPEIAKLTNLKGLGIAYNRIPSLPDEIGKCTQLYSITAWQAGLKKLPSTLANCTMLRDLLISENEIDSLPEQIGNLTKLYHLMAYINKIKNLPESIGACTSLVILELGDNLIDSMPPSICNLHNLETFSFSLNKVRCLPDSFGNLSKVDQLYLSRNQLTTLPPSIVKIVPFFGLNIRFNCIDKDKLTPEVLEWANKYDSGIPEWWKTQNITSTAQPSGSFVQDPKIFVDTVIGKKPKFVVHVQSEFGIKLYNAQGKVVYAKQTALYKKGTYYLFEKKHKLSGGSYVLVFTSSNNRKVERKLTIR